MARWWRHLLIAVAGTAAALPLRVQLDLGHGASWLIMDGTAFAKSGEAAGMGTAGAAKVTAAKAMAEAAAEMAKAVRNGGGRETGAATGTAAAKAVMVASAVGETQGVDPVSEAAAVVVPPEGVPALAPVMAAAAAKGTRMMAVGAA